jgi:tRNA threonylcarbamoyl adenosine modification protein YjeE
MTAPASPTFMAQICLPSPEATERLAQRIAEVLVPGDVLLIEGPIGAGKSHFCRAAIRHLLAKEGRDEDIPSPTFTLVQTYELHDKEIWHADLYRLTDSAQTSELGLEDAFETAVVLIEWPDRLGTAVPKSALRLSLTDKGDARIATFTANDPRWRDLVALLSTPDRADTNG